MIASHPMIELRELRRHFGTTKAVDDISFQVQRGEVFGYIGPNGAGKTTSMRILSTLDLPSRGDAFVDGFSVLNDPDRVRKRLGFMPDYYGTYPNVNVREYLDFFARAYGLRGGERNRLVRKVMNFTSLDELAHKPVSGLSKGMKQRLCLGRAIIHDPPVLVLDEPAAGLDPRARIQLREMIRQLAADGKAILISSHILTELAEICDRVGIIEQGKLLATGAIADIQAERKNQATIRVRVIGGAAALRPWLQERNRRFERSDETDQTPLTGASLETVEKVDIDGELATFVFHGDPHNMADLLREMIEADFRIASFASHAVSLEDIFMQITEGRVQ